MSEVACKHEKIGLFLARDGLKIRCYECADLIWEDTKITIKDFKARQETLYKNLGYDAKGRKLKVVAKQREYQNVKNEKVMGPDAFQRLENDPRIETAITDRDMLLLHIDMALDNGDEVAFDLLVQELEGAR